MKFCTQCGAQIGDSVKFCTTCGKPTADTGQIAKLSPSDSFETALNECSKSARRAEALLNDWLEVVDMLPPRYRPFYQGEGRLLGQAVVVIALTGLIGLFAGLTSGYALWFILAPVIGIAAGCLLCCIYLLPVLITLFTGPKWSKKTELGRIMQAEYDRYRALDDYISKEWNPLKQTLDIVALRTYGDRVRFPADYDKINEAHIFLQTLTKKKQRMMGAKRQLQDSAKMAAGVAAVTAIIGVGTALAVSSVAKSGMSDFGQRPNPNNRTT